jgi:hypothetical protein
MRWASSMDTTPTFSPFGPISRTCGTRIASLTRYVIALICSSLNPGFSDQSGQPRDDTKKHSNRQPPNGADFMVFTKLLTIWACRLQSSDPPV